MSEINLIFKFFRDYATSSKTEMEEALITPQKIEEQPNQSLSRWEQVKQAMRRHYQSTTETLAQHPVITMLALGALLAGVCVVWKLRSDASNLFERRVAIDAGSGGIKCCIADINKKTGKIAKVLSDKTYPVPLQKAVSNSSDCKSIPGASPSPDPSFHGSIQEQLAEALREIRMECDIYEVQKVRAIATAAYRQAETNGQQFVACMQWLTGIPLRIISQEQEGHIAFDSAVAVAGANPNKTVVYDIGTGSNQMTTKKDSRYEVFKEGLGAVPFKHYVMETIQDKDLKIHLTPNPISTADRKKALGFGEELAKKASQNLLKKVRQGEVLGIGGVFKNLLPHGTENEVIRLPALEKATTALLGMTDAQVNDKCADTQVSNHLQVEAVMKAMKIPAIKVVKTSTSEGMLAGPSKSFSSFAKTSKFKRLS